MDSYNLLTVLQNFLRIFSLHNVSSSNRGLTIDPWPTFRVTAILLTFGFLSSYNLYLHYTIDIMKSLSPSVVVVDTVDLLLCYFEYIVDLSFVYKYRSEMCAYYNNYSLMDVVLKTEYYRDIKKSVTILLGIFVPLWVIASLGQFSVWVSTAGWMSPITYAVSYFTFLIRLLTVLDFVSQTMHIKLRLRTITDHIAEFTAFADDSTNRIKTVRNTWGKKTEIKNKMKVTPFVSKGQIEITKTSSYYLLLIEQTKFVNRFFGVRALMHCLYTLTEMITFVNFVARVISGAMSAVMTSYVLLAPNMLRFVNCTAMLTILVYQCEACCHECDDVIDAIDRLLVNKIISEEVRSSLKTLRMLISTRPLKFTAAGFFNLESTLLLSIASVVITYALVLVQSTQ